MPRTASTHCGSSPVTRSTRSSPRTTRVARAIPAPPATRHANSTFSGVSGAWRIAGASALGQTCGARIILEQ